MIKKISLAELNVVCLGICLFLSGCNLKSELIPTFKTVELLDVELGQKDGMFGGLTLREIESKDDPLAYGDTSSPQDFAVDSLGSIVIADTANHRI